MERRVCTVFESFSVNFTHFKKNKCTEMKTFFTFTLRISYRREHPTKNAEAHGATLLSTEDQRTTARGHLIGAKGDFLSRGMAAVGFNKDHVQEDVLLQVWACQKEKDCDHWQLFKKWTCKQVSTCSFCRQGKYTSDGLEQRFRKEPKTK